MNHTVQKFLIKRPNKDLELFEFVPDQNQHEIDQAYAITDKIKEIIEEDVADSVRVGPINDTMYLTVGDNSRFYFSEEISFILEGRHPIPNLAVQTIHGPVVFSKKEYIEDFGFAYSGLSEKEIKAIKQAFELKIATDAQDNCYPVFLIDAYFAAMGFWD